ncbi:MAG: NAD(P)H-dependent oxidoreductase [Synergistaceae bacterium]|nr:NAD(P)H-dependent oxidoreductase [Synergistaceae bacterium]
MILFINTCVRPQSRTRRLAMEVLSRISHNENVREIKPVNLPLTNETLERRTKLSESGKFDDVIFEDAKTFASASQIVIAAPYWDLSFPAALKNYIEAVNVVGITFAYTEEGIPYGLCKAERLIYVTTAGGPIISDDYGYGYVRELSRSYWGIKDTAYVKAEGLDIIGADVENIITETVRRLDEALSSRHQ